MISKTDNWPRWMSKKTAAIYADVTLPTLEKWLKRGLPQTKTVTGAIRIDRERFDTWMAEQSNCPAQNKQEAPAS